MAVTDVVTLRVVGRYQGQNVVNTLHYQIIDQVAEEKDILEDLVDQWDTTVQPTWTADHIDSYELIGIKAFNKVGAGKVPAFRIINVFGSVVGEEVPSPVCRTITLYTASANFRRRGRVMISGCEVDMFNILDGSVTNAQVIILQTLGDLLFAELTAGGNTYQLGLPAGTAGAFEPIISSKPRVTPSLITSRRVNQFLVG